jgi:hypothetical protein
MAQELALLRQRYTDVEYRTDGQWVRVGAYALPEGWNRDTTDVAFQIPPAYPGTPPYGIYVPTGLMFNGSRPNNYNEPAGTQPPFGGSWGVFSWSHTEQWRATADLVTGANLLNWVMSFADRFREGA